MGCEYTHILEACETLEEESIRNLIHELGGKLKDEPCGIKRMIREGELNDPCTIEELLEQCGRLLDKACSHDILGEVLFEDNDGEVFVVCVEAVIGRANPDYVRDILAEDEEDG